MAMGRAVVSTTVGAEGLPVTNGEHVLLADEPRGFCRAVVRLLRDVERRRQLERAARALVVERYDWSAVAGELESALERVALRQARGERAATLSARAEPVGARASGRLS
jgi:glycosyltransferase involved in cell wall biosynthesis